MKKQLLAYSVLACMSIASHAFAADQERWPRWYIGLTGGVAFLDDSDLSGSRTGKQSYDTGWVGTASLGYRPAFSGQPFNHLRMEFELGYHSNGVDNTVATPATAGAIDGDVQAVSYMGNLFYDISTASPWTPYIGAGAGGASVHLNKSTGLGNTNSNDTVFAYQFMGGLAYAPSSMPMTEWTLGYRYFALDNPEFATATGAVKLDTPASHNVEVGAKFRF